MHHRQLMLLGLTSTYFGVALFGLTMFDAGLMVSAVVLAGIPAAVLAHFTLAPAAVVISVTLLGTGIATILEGVAHLYGLWYSLGTTEFRLLEVLPLEVIAALSLQILFLGLLYEILYDDGTYTVRSAYERSGFFIVFALASLGLVALHQLLLPSFVAGYPYLWLIVSFVGAAVLMLALHRNISVMLMDRLFDFVLIGALHGGLELWVASANVHKVFANPDAYIGTFSLFGEIVPIEEIALLFVVPFLVATAYELYLDDKTPTI